LSENGSSNQILQARPFATILTNRIVESFFIRLNSVDQYVEELLIVSPILGTLEGTNMTLERLLRILRVRKIRTIIITQSPDSEFTKNAPGHRMALEMLGSLSRLEIRFNNTLHAKIYVCVGNDKQNSFALLGSANMTKTSITHNIEIGMLIRYKYDGRLLIDELETFVKNKLRLNSQVFKTLASK
jgi:phosphatidylserine/phosphatidylglycerophosphate/cardiolipin synthase-like enzyme